MEKRNNKSLRIKEGGEKYEHMVNGGRGGESRE